MKGKIFQLGLGTAMASVAVVAAGAASATTAVAKTSLARSGSAIKVGMIYEKTGIYQIYAEQYRQGFGIGLDYATHGTNEVDGHKVNISWADDADNPTTAVTDFKSDVGAGDKIIMGTVDSGIALQLAPLAAQNKVLYIAGPAAADQLTGVNRYTFRSGRQVYQDVQTAKSFVSADGPGKTIVVLAQDYAFGQAYVSEAQTVFGSIGDKVEPLLVPLTTTDFTSTALQVKAMNPNLVFLAWAGTTGTPLAEALDQQGVFSGVKVVTGLANIATYPLYGAAGAAFSYLSLYVYQGSHNGPNDFLIAQMKKRYHSVPDLFTPDGFVAAQMLVRAIHKGGGTNVMSMIKSLEGWTFTAPKGEQHIRSADHAMLQPMYQVKLVQKGKTFTPVVLKTLNLSSTAPPLSAHFAG